MHGWVITYHMGYGMWLHKHATALVNLSGLHKYAAVRQWASYQIRKIAGCACTGNAGNVFPTTAVSDPVMHHGTNVTHVPWCMPGSLISSSPWSRWLGKHSRHSRCMRYLQFCVSGKRPMAWRRVGKTHYLNRWWSRSLVPNNVIRTQWVNRCNLVN